MPQTARRMAPDHVRRLTVLCQTAELVTNTCVHLHVTRFVQHKIMTSY